MRNFFYPILGCLSFAFIFLGSISFAYTQEEVDAYKWAHSIGITSATNISDANLEGSVTRQALSKMIITYLENTEGIRDTKGKSCTFVDENSITPALKSYTKKMCIYDIMGTNGKSFNPTSKVTNAQLGTVLSRMIWGDTYNVSGKQYYIYHLNALHNYGIMDNITNPAKTISKRGEVFVMLKRIYDNTKLTGDINTPTKVNINDNENLKSSTGAYTGITGDSILDTNNNSDNGTYGEKYLSNMYENSDVIYTSDDGKVYYYDGEFLSMLSNIAKESGEKKLSNYLSIEADYYNDSFNEISDTDYSDIYEKLGISEDLDFDSLSNKEKENLVTSLESGLNNMLKDNQSRLDNVLKNLKNASNISNDKYRLKDKYEKTKDFFEATQSFITNYCKLLISIIKNSISADGLDEDSSQLESQQMSNFFSLFGIAISYQMEEAEYSSYVKNWALDTIDILNGTATGYNRLDDSNEDRSYNIFSDLDNSKESDSLYLSDNSIAQGRARDITRKNDLSQIQTAIVTSQQDRGDFPGMKNNTGYDVEHSTNGTTSATSGIDVKAIGDNLQKAGLSSIPTDPNGSNKVTGLGASQSKGQYGYLVAKRNGIENAGFALMAKTETEKSSNWVTCKSGKGINKGYLTGGTDLSKITLCESITKGNECVSNTKACTYTDEGELRYLLTY